MSADGNRKGCAPSDGWTAATKAASMFPAGAAEVAKRGEGGGENPAVIQVENARVVVVVVVVLETTTAPRENARV